MGHSTTIPLDNHYGTFSNEAIFEEYKKAIYDLMIDDSEIQKNKVRKLEEEQKEIEVKKLLLDKQQDSRRCSYVRSWFCCWIVVKSFISFFS